LEVIVSFQERLEAPVEAEGFVLWRSRCQDELESGIEEIQELADRSEVDFAERDTAVQKQEQVENQGYVGLRDPTVAVCGGFRYREVRGRGIRGKYLRGVRRQVEYYFCDANLRQDWFFQEKIAAEPEPGWLELRWILSCPRIRDFQQANETDVLEALGPSSLIVKQLDGKYWIRRGRPPPPLSEPRPKKGNEPDWYKRLHDEDIAIVQATDADICADGDPENPRCGRCGKDHPKSYFSKAQLTKHRKNPTCKDCVDGCDAK
jgi:hypothetical protein